MDLNFQAARVAQELLAWDKARATGLLGEPAADDAGRIIEQGADYYRRQLLALHGAVEACSLEEGEEWIGRSEDQRRGRQYMTKQGGPLRRDQLLLTEEDYDRLDRHRPELSFSGAEPEAVPDDDIADQLRRLAALHREGALTDTEFASAKARVLEL